MSEPGIVVHPNLTNEVVEFWGFKYREAKQENETLQTRIVENDKFLQEVITSSRNEMKIMQQKLDAYHAENANLLSEIGRLGAERAALHTQLQLSYSQALSLAPEADRQRRAAIVDLFKAQPIVDYLLNETPPDLSFLSARDLASTLRRVSRRFSLPLYFNPCPPNAMPLRVEGPCQPGYWFYPLNLQMESPFELIVEAEPNKWTYFGRYITCAFSGYEMKLSEWMTLDEESKTIFCSRVANQRSGGRQASLPTQVHIRQRYDSGLWNIPSYTLQCVGYDSELCNALAAAAVRLACGHAESIERQAEVASISRQSSLSQLGKRRRTETPPTCGDQSTKVETSGFPDVENIRVDERTELIGQNEYP
ncbi:Dolichyl-diphosphooligosaccharide--protein glycosyltransferase subunit WBP1 [Favolaschia claudopus]|uniref:Dolichyl-diphosphooligosaccharide--protein glycosyltransferase subunit WBP1 n=1 Tax=Favolaschia claudopus TaxID=2862362 RepID=A0AAW0BED2_9AGAR